jgi:putative methyltransferase
VDDVVSGIDRGPDLLCLSCYVWNHNQQMAIARRVKARYPHCLVVCGGPHVPEQPGDFFRGFPMRTSLSTAKGKSRLPACLREILEEKTEF